MAVEIGELVLRGTFGPATTEAAPESKLIDAKLDDLRHELLDEMREMIRELSRRAREG
jgi:hypothetical protein